MANLLTGIALGLLIMPSLRFIRGLFREDMREEPMPLERQNYPQPTGDWRSLGTRKDSAE